jgi:hypothetical protein
MDTLPAREKGVLAQIDRCEPLSWKIVRDRIGDQDIRVMDHASELCFLVPFAATTPATAVVVVSGGGAPLLPLLLFKRKDSLDQFLCIEIIGSFDQQRVRGEDHKIRIRPNLSLLLSDDHPRMDTMAVEGSNIVEINIWREISDDLIAKRVKCATEGSCNLLMVGGGSVNNNRGFQKRERLRIEKMIIDEKETEEIDEEECERVEKHLRASWR